MPLPLWRYRLRGRLQGLRSLRDPLAVFLTGVAVLILEGAIFGMLGMGSGRHLNVSAGIFVCTLVAVLALIIVADHRLGNWRPNAPEGAPVGLTKVTRAEVARFE